MKTFEKAISHLLKTIDIFGYKTELQMEGKSQYRTLLGGTLTLLMIALGMFLLIYFGNDMYYKISPNVFSSNVWEKEPKAFNFSKETSFFMFGIEHIGTYQHFYDTTIYTAHLNIETVSKAGVIKKSVPLEPCTDAHLPSNPDLFEYFINAPKAPLRNLICVKKEYFNSLSISGSFDSEIYQNIKIYINPCQNSTTNNFSCQSPENITSQLTGYFAFYTMDYIVNPADYATPASPYGIDYFGFVRPSTTLMSNRYIAITDINTNFGWMMDDFSQERFPTLAQEKESITIGDNSTLVVYCIRRFHTKKELQRSYKKLQVVLAEIGGILNVLFIVFRSIAYPLVHQQFFKKLTNSVFNFEGGEDAKKRKLEMKSKRAKKLKNQLDTILATEINSAFQRNPSFSFSENNRGNVNMVSSIMEKSDFQDRKKKKIVEVFLKLQKKKLNISWWQVLKSYFVKNDDLKIKFKQNERAIKQIKNKLSITYILRKFVELDKLKALVLFIKFHQNAV